MVKQRYERLHISKSLNLTAPKKKISSHSTHIHIFILSFGRKDDPRLGILVGSINLDRIIKSKDFPEITHVQY